MYNQGDESFIEHVNFIKETEILHFQSPEMDSPNEKGISMRY